MVQNDLLDYGFPRPRPQRLFYPAEDPVSAFPIQSVTIDWERLARKRPIVDHALKDRIQSYLYANHFRASDRIFPMCRKTVNRHIHALVERVGGAPFPISAHTFRHSFAIHLLLHACPLKIVSKLMGHQSMDSTEVYTNVLTVDSEHFLEGVEFH